MDPDTPIHRLNADARSAVRGRVGAVLAADRRVAFAFAFGSFAEDRPFHDIDVGVYFQDPVADRRLADLEARLAAAAGFPVDLVVLNDRPVTFVYHVFRGHALFARDEAQLTSALEQTMRDYFDIAPVLRQATREAFGT